MFNLMESSCAIETEIIEKQLERLQKSPQFSYSHRYPIFLNYVVHQTLKGHQDNLKERTIGIEAFGRAPYYDSNEDPIVRVTAAEVRRRLAQYYYEPEHQNEVRIELRPGSYVPEFRYVLSDNSEEHAVPSTLKVSTAFIVPSLGVERAPEHSSHVPIWRSGAAILVTTLVAAAVAAGILLLHKSPIDRFWQPTVNAEGQVLISVGSVQVLEHHLPSGTESENAGAHPLLRDPVALADTMAMSRLQHVLSNYQKASVIQSSVDTTFADLCKGPILLIAAFDNPWTMRLAAPLRFHFVQTQKYRYEIQDRTNVNNRWAIDTSTPFTEMTSDYGVVARFHDPTTDQIVVVAAGLGENGTIAASEFLADGKDFDLLRRKKQLPRREQNFEAVLETQIINGTAGPPRIVATYIW